jgi:hypothetical protein
MVEHASSGGKLKIYIPKFKALELKGKSFGKNISQKLK